MARSRTFRPRSSSRPNRSWGGLAFATYTTVGAASKVLLGSLTLSNPGIDETHLRTVGVLSVRSDQKVASEDMLGAIGMILVSDQALATGITAIPGPTTDIADDGWLFYQPIVQTFEFVSSVGFDSQGAVQYHFDSKGKRIVHDGVSIALVAQNSGSTGWAVGVVLRTLSQVTGT